MHRVAANASFWQAFFHMIINNSYGPLIHALPLSLADQTGGFDTNREVAEQELRERSSTADGHSVADDDIKKEKAQPTSISTVDIINPDMGETSATSSPQIPQDAENDTEEGPHTENPPEIKPVDEDAGPKEFYHPASVEPQRIVWLPQDQLGVAAEEEGEIREAGISVSTEGAVMDNKGHVDINGAPPGGEVRVF